jgi:DNA mismatch repair protein MutS
VTGPSVLRLASEAGSTRERAAPECFADLNLDQVIATITGDREAYRLESYYYAPLSDADAVAYRHEVFRDLRRGELRAHVESFAEAMRQSRERTRHAALLRDVRQRRRLHLDGASCYCEAVTGLTRALQQLRPRSRGLRALAAYLEAYLASPPFAALQADTEHLLRTLGDVRYGLTILPDRVTVRRSAAGIDDGVAIERAFARFEGPADDAMPTLPPSYALNSVESAVLERLTQLFPEVFGQLDAFADRHADYHEPVIAVFDREIQFYLAYLDYVARFEAAGLGFCFPTVAAGHDELLVEEAFDTALAERLLEEGGFVVTNDFRLSPGERIFVVTGANQGGKTTFARMVGQVHYLASLGCPVPARVARVPLCDELLTHFEKEEDPRQLRGRLQDELMRLQALLERATPRSLLIVNEVFASTTIDDARLLGRRVLVRLLERQLPAVWVTFVEELASFDPRIVSVVSTVDPASPLRRTFKLLRRPADGRAHALALAKAHGLTYEDLRRRLRP